MGDSSESYEKRQLIVFFDVGGVIVRVLRETIQNYPSSLLAKLVEEFPNLGYEDKPVFIDRSPTAFGWIREIYRNGDFESCIPDMSRAALVRELKFYQLPDISKLGISSFKPKSDEIKKASNWCGSLLAEELTKQNLWTSLPLYAWFYKEVKKSDSTALSREKVLVTHLYGSYKYLGIPKEQLAFTDSIRELSLSSGGSCWRLTCDKESHRRFLIRNVANPQVYSMLQRAALEYGLRLEYPAQVQSHKGVLVVKPKDVGDRAVS